MAHHPNRVERPVPGAQRLPVLTVVNLGGHNLVGAILGCLTNHKETHVSYILIFMRYFTKDEPATYPFLSPSSKVTRSRVGVQCPLDYNGYGRRQNNNPVGGVTRSQDTTNCDSNSKKVCDIGPLLLRRPFMSSFFRFDIHRVGS